MTQHELINSLASYVSGDDEALTRKEFLFAVATRILDDLQIDHALMTVALTKGGDDAD